MTVWDNIAFGLARSQDTCAVEIAARVDELLKLIQMQGYERRFPASCRRDSANGSPWRALAPTARVPLGRTLPAPWTPRCATTTFLDSPLCNGKPMSPPCS